MKTLLTYKGIKYLCIAAALPTTAVVTHKSHKQINRMVERVQPNPARRHVTVVRQSIQATAPYIAPAAAIASAECVTAGGFAGGGGGSSSPIGGYLGGAGSFVAPPPVSTTSPVPEPSGWAMMILGFGIFGGVMRRKPHPATTADQKGQNR